MNEAAEETSAEAAPRRKFGLYIGRFFGIRFYLDYSWFLIAALVVWGLSSRFFPLAVPGHAPAIYLGMGLLAAALFFLSILLHELGHSLVSQRCGIPVPRITLLFIGGVAEIAREPDTAAKELKIALGGPAVTLGLIMLYAALGMGLAAAGLPPAAVVMKWLAGVNLILLLFNAIPGFPLDGGRVLRAVIWGRTGNFRKATFVTTRIGVAFSWFLIIAGVYLIFIAPLNGFIFLIIGIFLKGAAEMGYQQAVFGEVLEGVTIGDIMTRQPLCIPAHTPLNLAVDEYFLTHHHVAYPVTDEDGGFAGILRLRHLKEIEREKWPYTTAGNAAMIGEALTVRSDADAGATMPRLLQRDSGRLAVLEGDRVVGIITRADVLKYIRIHRELED